MTDKEIYKFFRKHWKRVGDEITCKSRSGDKNATMDMMPHMIVSATIEKALGYEMSDDGKRIIKRVRPNKRSKEMELTLRAKDGDIEAAYELLDIMSGKFQKQNNYTT